MYHRIHEAQPAGGSDLPCPGSRDPDKPLPTGLATASYAPLGRRIRVQILGELDLDSADGLRPGLHRALAASDAGLDLDLGGLDFCDCAGLAALMELRQRADSQGKTVFIRVGSRMVDRLLGLLGAQELFTPPDPPRSELHHPAPATAPAPKTGTGTSLGHMSSRGRTNGIGCRQAPRY
ncbi:anti-sigma factor antagonist [Streptomyces sp. Ru62]|uniref:STAS domain-containing protein n=1 Tax=Streptomyces sp. Ru62 TaxID=2080745 RepID=UPI000CDD98C7|nr:STAS domain-containing protein [Streptomyces sp. Ru62]POX59000.1 anti-sigma factor antagonist [Streptomyces sp. Ru62]